MKLKFRIKSLDEVEEQYRSMYVKNADGSFTLEIEGVVPKETLDEFRNKNIELLKEAEKFKDLNPEKYQELLALQKKREEKELLDKGEIDTVIANRVQEMKTSYENQIKTLTENITTSNRQLETLMIDNTVRDMAIKSGVRETAVDDVLLRAKTKFSIKDGKVVALQVKDGKQEIVYGSDGQTPLGISEWGKNLKTEAPHLFKDSNGGGAQGSGSSRPGQKATTALGKISAGLESGM